MGIGKGSHLAIRDYYIDYPFEEVMFRWDCSNEKFYRKFYDQSECSINILHDNKLLNDALLNADAVTKEVYEAGKRKHF